MDNVLSGRYRLLDEVGTGGSARVFRAIDEKRKRIVAIKYIQSPGKISRGMAMRFYREIAAFSRMNHPHIVGFISAHFRPPLCYIVSEYVEGASLSTILDRLVRIPPQMALSIMVELFSALEYMHSKGFIHADLSPSNIMITKAGLAQLTDFGLVRHTREGSGNVLFGTPGYYSPEHLKLKTLAPKSDVFSLSLVLFEMLTGQRALPPINDRRAVLAFMEAIPFDVIDGGDPFRTQMLQQLMKNLLARSFFSRINQAAEAGLLVTKVMKICRYEYIPGSLQALVQQVADRRTKERSVFRSAYTG